MDVGETPISQAQAVIAELKRLSLSGPQLELGFLRGDSPRVELSRPGAQPL